MWDQRYDREDYFYGTEPNAFLMAQAHRLKAGMRALAVADGEGRNGVWLAEQGLAVTSIDSSSVGLAKARRLAASRGVAVAFEQADVATWPWPPAAYDVVAAIFIQFAAPALREKLFEDFKATLKPGGLLLLQGYRPEQVDYATGGPSERENMYTREMLAGAFGDFDILLLREHDSEIHEGVRHSGLSALVDLVAQKPV
ncbi:SAM-dependent methyltransferase [Consotaella aegiceratis]|uniref:SAM-dependent methyltransferase n=1 Tax=Consotaella aegiceratis TaxID=3097961 RepID=UPI002F3EFA94